MTPAEAALDQVLIPLTAFFLDGAKGDTVLARAAAKHMLDGYAPADTEELQCAAQIVAFGFAAMESLSRSVADKDLSVTNKLRLRSSANAMHRNAEKSRKTLDVRRKARAARTPLPVEPAAPADFQASMQIAHDARALAHADLAPPHLTPPRLSRADRRAAKWQARQSAQALASTASQCAGFARTLAL